MKRITNIIVNKRYFILITFIIIAIICGIATKQVNINNDMTKYLPNTSETRKGMDIMEKEFSDVQETSSLKVMYKGLNEQEKQNIYNELQNIEKVSEVEYDETEKYNKGEYTLYIINVEGSSDSEDAKQVYNEITEKYKDYEIQTSGEINNSNMDVLPTWIIVVAISGVLIILLFMCESYIEPLLFLFSILIAVLINNGTNIIFENVSVITSSISAILQLALSMDYSIMLMNRFRQEKETEEDKIKAMKNALYHSFKSISSSSITTIVGLVALVFMSFKIGKDLGLVLAKGVLLSLICIFCILPGLILIFDKLITKTKKKTLNIKLNKVGNISHKIRYPLTILFVAVFVISYLLKGSLNILYTASEMDEISKVFGTDNQIAIIYKNNEEEKISKNLKNIEQEQKVESVLGYGNTINEKLKAEELVGKFEELGTNVDIENYLLKIIYYKYYNPNENNTLTFDEMVKFIQNDVYNNPKMEKELNANIKNEIDRLSNFTDKNLVKQVRTSSEIANILGIEKNNIDDILVYYNSKNNNLEITLKNFINFMNNTVLKDSKYGASIDKKTRESLAQLTKFTDNTTINKKYTSKEMAKLFNMSESDIESLYTYYVSTNEITTKLTLSQFSNFVISVVLTNPTYANMFNNETVNSIKMLQTFSNNDIINKNMTAKELANILGIDENSCTQLLLLKYMNTDNGTSMTIQEFLNAVIKIGSLENSPIDENTLNSLKILKMTIDPSILESTIKYTATEMSNILGINENQIYSLYALIDFTNGNTKNWKSTPYEFVNLILNNKENEQIKNSISENQINNLNLLIKIMKSAINKQTYSYNELANFINSDAKNIKSIYGLYNSKNTITKLTPIQFVNFVLNHKKDSLLSEKLNSSTINSLNLLQSVMNGITNNTKYSSNKISSLLGIDKSKIDLLYGLYVSKTNTNQKMALNTLVDFIVNDVMNNKEFSGNFDNNSKLKLNTVQSIIKASNLNTKYSKDEMIAILSNLSDDMDNNTIELLYLYYGSSKEYNEDWQLTIEKFVNYLNDDILVDSRFTNFIDEDMKNKIIDSKKTVSDAKEMLVGDNYSRVVINTKLDSESEETFNFVQKMEDMLKQENDEFYIIGDSPMAYEMSKTFGDEFNYISILTMIAIFIVVCITFKSILIPLILVAVIQCAVYMTMGILSVSGGSVYYLALLIVQSILMGSTIDYAILYTSYYLEFRGKMNKKESIINAYNESIHTILTSATILIIVTFIVGSFATAITSKICITLSQGTLCAELLILIFLPALLATFDKFVVKSK